MAWFSLTADVKHEELERAVGLLHEAGASGLEVRDGPATMPGVRAPAPGDAIVVAYFEGRAAGAKADRALKAALEAARTALEKVEERDWSTEWKTRIKSVRVGRLWVGPPWDLGQAPAHLVKIAIEPKMAFGTGDHPTTTLCLQAVDLFMAAHAGASVLDVGTGTGVLALAAKRLGATRVVAIDNDPVSVQLASEAARENGVAGVELSTKSLRQVSGTFDLVVANILANTLIELAPLVVPKVGKRLVLAGILLPQAQSVSAEYARRGLCALPPVESGEWVRLDFERR